MTGIARGAVILTGLNSAVLGLSSEGKIVYGYEKMLRKFRDDGMTNQDAAEWIDFNVLPLMATGEGFILCYQDRISLEAN